MYDDDLRRRFKTNITSDLFFFRRNSYSYAHCRVCTIYSQNFYDLYTILRTGRSLQLNRDCMRGLNHFDRCYINFSFISGNNRATSLFARATLYTDDSYKTVYYSGVIRARYSSSPCCRRTVLSRETAHYFSYAYRPKCMINKQGWKSIRWRVFFFFVRSNLVALVYLCCVYTHTRVQNSFVIPSDRG